MLKPGDFPDTMIYTQYLCPASMIHIFSAWYSRCTIVNGIHDTQYLCMVSLIHNIYVCMVSMLHNIYAQITSHIVSIVIDFSINRLSTGG